MSDATPHEILGVHPTATTAEIKTSWRRLILANHPDKSPEDEREAATKRFREIHYAYEVLTNPEQAAEYAAEKRRERRDEKRAENARAEAAKAKAEAEQEKDVQEAEESRPKRQESSPKDHTIPRAARPKEPCEEQKERQVPDTQRNRGRRRHEDAERGDHARGHDKAGKKGVRFTRGSTPPPQRGRSISPSPERRYRQRRRSPSQRRSRDVPEHPRTPGAGAQKRKSRPDDIHLEHDRNARTNERHAGVRRTPSRRSFQPTGVPPLTPLSPTVRRPKSVYHLNHGKDAQRGAVPTPTLTSTALQAAHFLSTHLTGLRNFLTTDLRLSMNSNRPNQVTDTLSLLASLTRRLHTLQSHADASLAAQARALASPSPRQHHSTAQRDLAYVITHVSKLERTLNFHAKKVQTCLYEVLPPSGAMRVGAAAAGAVVDEEVVRVVHRGWEAQREREREGEGRQAAMWTAEKRSRLWGVVEALEEDASELLGSKQR